MLVLTHASFATVEQLFHYKHQGLKLPPFPGYTNDQWGIKAHNRAWIEDAGKFTNGQRVIEVGGAYSLLPKYLSQKYQVEAWIADDFGMNSGENIWARWGNPLDLPNLHPEIHYVFERFGSFSPSFPDCYFDCIFSVSTLEHIPLELRPAVLEDMHRCLVKGGRQLHSIDVATFPLSRALKFALKDRIVSTAPFLKHFTRGVSEINDWIDTIKKSGVHIECKVPSPLQLLDRRYLVESPDVIYRFYPPNDAPKPYNPAASLLLIIENL
jgi:SAM-dependent methyltransferase